ncbi:MAG: bifunctional nuclease family protein [Desulfovibrionaceae bacterium]|nr:bifunctional nuclease family protein [Desulfovibrionaceae bacterium]
MVELQLDGLYADKDDKEVNMAVLKEVDGDHSFTLEIGPMESLTLSLAMQKETLPRPLTIDLIVFVLRALNAQFLHAIITGFRDNMFYAAIEIAHANRRIRIDARPSDALALSLRTARPIYASAILLDKIEEMASRKTEETLLIKTPDAATEMVRRSSAKHILDMMNASENVNVETQEDEHLLELLKSLEPASRHKM